MKPVEIEFLIQNNTKAGLSEVSFGMDAVQQDSEQAQAVLAALRGELARLHAQMRESPTIDTSENIAMIDALKAKIEELEAGLKKTGAAIPPLVTTAQNAKLTPKDLPNATRSFNGLNFSIQQIAREMPTLAMGPQMFFMAISNNLPIFADEVGRARKEYDLLVASGQKGTPVWKQILSSLFSWQTAMTAGIMLTVLHGKEIGNWIKELFRGNTSLDAAKASADQFHATMVEGARNAQQEVTKLNLLYRAATDNTRSMDDRREAVSKLKEEYPDYFKNLSDEQIMLGQTNDAYKNLVKNIYEYAKAQAAFKSMVDLEQQSQLFDNAGNIDNFRSSYDKYLKTQQDVVAKRKIYDDTPWTKRGNASKPYQDLTWAKALSMDAVRDLESQQKLVLGEVAKLGGGEELIEQIKDKFDGDLGAYLQFVADHKAKLAKVAENVYLTDDPRKPPKPPKAPAPENFAEQLSDKEIAARQHVEELTVAAMKEGYKKQRAQAELNFQKEKDRITKEEQERLALVEKLRKSGAKITPGTEIGIQADAATLRVKAAQIRDDELTKIDSKEQKEASDLQKKETDKLNKLLSKYADFEAQRAAIKKQGDDDISKLNAQRTAANSQEIDRAIAVAKAQVEQGIQSINDTEAGAASKDNGFLKKLFGDYSSMSFDSLRNLISEARQLQQYLSGNGSAAGVTFISEAELKNIEKSPAELDKLRKALDKLLDSGAGGNNKWEDIFKTFEKGLAELKGARGFKEISGAIGTIGGVASAAAEELADMFEQMGDTQTADAISGVQQVMSAVSNIGQGFAKGGIVGGVGAAIGEVANFIGQAFMAEARHRAALKEIERAKLDFQRQYNLALLEQNLLLEHATNIFGERQISKAANAVQNYKNALGQLKGELAGDASRGAYYDKMAGSWIDRLSGGSFSKKAEMYQKGLGGLAEASIVTGHKKTGLFGWGKGKDVYSSLLDVYPELIDKNGEMDASMLQTILDTRKMSDATKSYLQNLIDLKGAMDEAEKALEDYLQQTFGSLGQGILDSITSALKGGESAMENFAGKAASIFENLGEQVAYSLFFADQFDALQQQLKKTYGSGKSEEQIANDAMSLIDSFYDNIGSNVGAAQQWLEEWKKKAEEMGFDLWKPEGTAQSGKAGALTTLTQDQGTKLEGLMTSLQIHAVSLDEKMDNVTVGLGGCLDSLKKIAENTDTLPLMLALWQTIKRDGLKIK